MRLERRGSEDEAVVLFRVSEGDRLFGFGMQAVEPLEPDGSLYDGEPEGWAEVILTNLEEAILTGSRVKSRSEGITWVQ